jgi:hypothetical protein
MKHLEIAASRKNNSPIIASRSHQLHRVYVAESPATDLVVLGNFRIDLKDGNYVSIDFTARFVVVTGDREQEARFQFVQVWTDPTDMKVAFEKAKSTLAGQK